MNYSDIIKDISAYTTDYPWVPPASCAFSVCMHSVPVRVCHLKKEVEVREYAIVSSKLDKDGNVEETYAQLYNATGHKVGAELKVHDYTIHDQLEDLQ